MGEHITGTNAFAYYSRSCQQQVRLMDACKSPTPLRSPLEFFVFGLSPTFTGQGGPRHKEFTRLGTPQRGGGGFWRIFLCVFLFSGSDYLGGNFGPEKKYVTPPPAPPNISHKHPSPPHPPRNPPPLLGFSSKISPPLLPGASDSPFPSP